MAPALELYSVIDERARVTQRQVVRREIPSSAALGGDLHPVLARVYAARQVSSPDELDHSLQRLHPYTALKDMERAVEVLVDALRGKRRILVIGDFDADGATSCAVAMRGLRMLGAEHVDYLVPNRFEFGYGLTPEIVAVAAGRAPDLLITVDNGISSIAGAFAARELGVELLITDHHLPGSELPHASAIVNPNQPGDDFPSKHLAGVGVMFYVLIALRARLRDIGWFGRGANSEPNLAQLLDLVAIGTVADVVRLDQNNRILVAQGLARIRAGRAHAGVRALLRVAGRDPASITAGDLGFAIGPRLNAAGRLTDMSLGISCLETDDDGVAQDAALRLDQLNRDRRTIEADMQEQAMAHLDALGLDGDLPLGLCLYDEEWHQGVVGILASRVKDRLHRPVVAFAAQDETHIKGSARSVSGVHVRDALAAVAALHPDLLTHFGGHAMAAGLSLRRCDLEAFTQAFDVEVRRQLGGRELRGTLYSDGALSREQLSLDLAQTLRDSGPWGQGFPEPLFDGEFDVFARRVVGDRHVKMQLGTAGYGSRRLDAIAFNAVADAWPQELSRAHVAYRLDVNDYRGQKTAQLVVENLKPLR